MSGEEEMVNLLIHNGNGQSQMIKIQKGSQVGLLRNSKLITNQSIKGISNQESKQLVNGIGTSGTTTIVRVRPVKNKPVASVNTKTTTNTDGSVTVSVTNSLPIAIVSTNSDDAINVLNSDEYNQYSSESASDELNNDGVGSQEEFLSAVLEQHSNNNRKRQSLTNGSKRLQVSSTKRRRIDKSGKGLRHFSMKVCEKVRQKGTTTYNEVADELVEEFTNPENQAFIGEQYDQKNIRRRVYDALNVLMAMNIISKERKEIKWIGLPTNSLQECINLLNDRKVRMAQVTEKLKHLYDLILHQISYKRLVQRNHQMEQATGNLKDTCRLHIPFILVSTSKKTFVDCNISHDKTEYLMLYDDKFEIHDDVEVLKRMDLVLGLDKGQCTGENLNLAKSLVPKVLEKYVTRLAKGQMELTMEDLKELVNDTDKNEIFKSVSNNVFKRIQDKEKLHFDHRSHVENVLMLRHQHRLANDSSDDCLSE